MSDFYTLDQLFNSKSDTSISYDTLAVYQLVHNAYLCTHTILDDYRKEIFSLASTYKLDYDQYWKYYQSPQLLSYDIYETTDLDYFILYINKMTDMKDFTKDKVKLIHPNDISELLSSIYSSNKDILMRIKNEM